MTTMLGAVAPLQSSLSGRFCRATIALNGRTIMMRTPPFIATSCSITLSSSLHPYLRSRITSSSPTPYDQQKVFKRSNAEVAGGASSNSDTDFATPLHIEYRNRSHSGLSEHPFDPHQYVVLEALQVLRDRIIPSAFESFAASVPEKKADEGDKSSWLSFLADFRSSSTPSLNTSAFSSVGKNVQTGEGGLYLHGPVGCGKTYCMRLFHDVILRDFKVWSVQKQQKQEEDTGSSPVQYAHYHEFMLRFHKRIHHYRNTEGIGGDEAIPRIVSEIMENGPILCLDEFQVTDISDAMMLRSLFTQLWEAGAVLVATSNRAPMDLYKNGIQRDLFVPFLYLMEQRCNVLGMWNSELDYRLVLGSQKAEGVYFIANKMDAVSSKAERLKFDRVCRMLTKGDEHKLGVVNLDVQGHNVNIERGSLKMGVAVARFEELCKRPLGAADYIAVAENFHTLLLVDVPRLSLADMNVVRRFITLVDALYDSGTKLITLAEEAPENLFDAGDGTGSHDEIFAFDRTVSRLKEMCSEEYLRRSVW
eukprot:CAMPEP_0113309504 /NCGR_PEP_ID=MMETSP0010_2-20120614/7520_1 /TAXON_ID=216773 ORGANISM="Corethron hystrix, Strain 308" /NCGR_SAMPLE_ID=MMETSP0010_2 /ASSEMBLY_ACC=CAM_ASM_000155 /LENGTH=532 /DNA_ID=CAMNT_0000164767 /DNA_START=81 /DNA_END=1676 /DNA_ORIENTATION=- /assembly_acc=CAM_ASM_000155